MSRYRIRAVAELTGVSTATLRAWERRYGVPTPSRTASAYRLYGDEDVALVTQMRDLVESGVAPAEAARALREHATTGTDTTGETDPYQLAADRIVSAAQRFDVEMIREEVTRSLSLGPAVAIFDRALGPALVQIGDLWHKGQLTVAQEHLVSNVLLGRVSQLLELIQPVDSTRKVVLACFEEEDHVIGLYGAAIHFAAWGYRSVFLGARTPPDAVARVVGTLKVDVVALSTTCAPPVAKARALVDAYADACRGVPWLVGGHGLEGMSKFVVARGGIPASLSFPELRKAVDRAIRGDRKSQGPASDAEGSRAHEP